MKLILFSLLFAVTAQANDFNSVSVNTATTPARVLEWSNEKTIVFEVADLPNGLVVQCGPFERGHIGTPVHPYSGYDIYRLSVTVPVAQCLEIRDRILDGQTLTFNWLKAPTNPNCGGYIDCDYQPNFDVK